MHVRLLLFFVAACRVDPRAALVGGKRGRLLPLRRRAAARMYLDVFKDGSLVETYELSASKRVYRVGRQKGSADIVLEHGSISREQATLTVSASGTVVVVDLRSAHGTKLSGKAIEPNKPHTLPPGRSLTFGQSTRVFKLREGAASGFVSQPGIGQAAAAASFVLDDPRVQAVLAVLRNGHAQCGERLRPDGFVRLHAVLGCGPVQRAGCTEAELASLPAKLQTHVGASTDDDVHGHGTGEILLRALDDNGDGKIQYKEFMGLARATGLDPKRMRAKFVQRDLTDSGELSMKDMEQILTELRDEAIKKQVEGEERSAEERALQKYAQTTNPDMSKLVEGLI